MTALVLSACSAGGDPAGDDAAGEGNFTIGFMHDVTGSVGPYGIAEMRGGQIAIDEFNEAGGFDGRLAETIEFDLGSDTAATTAGVRSLAADGVVAIHGPTGSGALVVGAPVASQSEIVILAPSSTENFDEGVLNEWTFRVGPVEALRFDTILPQVLEAAGDPKRIALFYSSENNSSVEERELLEEYQEAEGYKLVAVETVPADQTEVTAEVSRILAAEPDAIYMSHRTAESAAFMNAVRARGSEVPFIGGPSFATASIFELTGENGDGSITFVPFLASSSNPKVQSFVQAFNEEFGEDPDLFAAHGYDGMLAILEAIKAADSTDRAAIRDALATLSGVEGAVGPIEYDGTSQDNVGAEYTLVAVEDGQFVPIN